MPTYESNVDQTLIANCINKLYYSNILPILTTTYSLKITQVSNNIYD